MLSSEVLHFQGKHKGAYLGPSNNNLKFKCLSQSYEQVIPQRLTVKACGSDDSAIVMKGTSTSSKEPLHGDPAAAFTPAIQLLHQQLVVGNTSKLHGQRRSFSHLIIGKARTLPASETRTGPT